MDEKAKAEKAAEVAEVKRMVAECAPLVQMSHRDLTALVLMHAMVARLEMQTACEVVNRAFDIADEFEKRRKA